MALISLNNTRELPPAPIVIVEATLSLVELEETEAELWAERLDIRFMNLSASLKAIK